MKNTEHGVYYTLVNKRTGDHFSFVRSGFDQQGVFYTLADEAHPASLTELELYLTLQEIVHRGLANQLKEYELVCYRLTEVNTSVNMESIIESIEAAAIVDKLSRKE